MVWPAVNDGERALQKARWQVLDDASVWQGFSRPDAASPGTWTSFLAIGGMHCAGCAQTVEQALCGLPGVAAVRVSGASALAQVRWSPDQGRPSQWLAALDRAGYSAVPAGDQLGAEQRRKAQRLMLWRWLAAGFCMMQVMGYASPAYFAADGEITPDIVGLLRWASWMMTLPVLVFCCQPFFAAAWRDLRQRRVGMDLTVALGLLVAFVASTAATFDPHGPWGGEVWYDSVTMFVFFLLSGRLLEHGLRDRTAGALEALVRRLPDSVERQTADGGFARVASHRLAVGDVLRVLPGEVVPADGQVLAGESQVDEALLTGESTPLRRQAGDAVVAGSLNLSGALELRVQQVGPDTRYAAIVALMEQAAVDKPRLAQLADRVAGPFLGVVLLLALAAGLWWWPQGPSHAIGVAVAVLIVTCPCALSLATPAATLAAAGALARRGVLVRRLQALEEGAALTQLVFDKTGTLTQDRLRVGAATCRAGMDEARLRQQAAALAAGSLHPVARAVARQADAGPWVAASVQELAGLGVQGQVGLAPGPGGGAQSLLRLGSARFCDAPPALATGPAVHLADAQGWLASLALAEELRPDAAATVAALQAQGLGVAVLSGDQPAAVARVAAQAGVTDWQGGCPPQDKLAWLARQQAGGRHVAMVGDGLNDGPVLARANLSVALGDAVPLAQARADVVIPGGQLASVALLLRHARRTQAVVRQNLAWAVAYNALAVPLAVMGWMPPWLAGLGMAASSLLVVLNAARLARLD